MIKFISTTFLILFAYQANAFRYGNGECIATNGTKNYIQTLNQTIKKESNKVNTSLPKEFFFGQGLYKGECHYKKGWTLATPILYKAESKYPVITVNGEKYIKVNEYVAFSISFFIGGHLNKNVNAPFLNISNEDSSNNDIPFNFSTGSKGSIKVLILRPIINEVSFNGELVSLYARLSNSGAQYGLTPIATVAFNIRLTANNICVFDSNNGYDVDFGVLNPSSFTQNGKGKISKDINLGLKCDAPYNLNYSILATPGPNNTVSSSNPSIGVLFQDENTGEIISPVKQNEIQVPISSDNSGKISLHLTPMRISDKIKPGAFSGSATVQLSFK